MDHIRMIQTIRKILLNKWKSKSTTSKYYQNAIYHWTILDPQKQQTAILNKLNYLTIYSINFDNIVNIINTYITKNYGNL